MSEFDFHQAKSTSWYVKKELEGGTNALESLGKLKVWVKGIRGSERPKRIMSFPVGRSRSF
jgi:hypothetical protein